MEPFLNKKLVGVDFDAMTSRNAVSSQFCIQLVNLFHLFDKIGFRPGECELKIGDHAVKFRVVEPLGNVNGAVERGVNGVEQGVTTDGNEERIG